MNSRGEYVLYWMTANRRRRYNFGLQRAVDWARRLNKPILILEALRCDYTWASDRLLQFIIAGMRDNAEGFRPFPYVTYYPYVEPRRGAGKGLLSALATSACIVIADDFPAFFLPRMLETAARILPVAMEGVDSNGILPLRASGRAYPTAYGFRRFLQKHLLKHLAEMPAADCLQGLQLPAAGPLPARILRRWPRAPEVIGRENPDLARLPIDHRVPPAPVLDGGRQALARLRDFVALSSPLHKGRQVWIFLPWRLIIGSLRTKQR